MTTMKKIFLTFIVIIVLQTIGFAQQQIRIIFIEEMNAFEYVNISVSKTDWDKMSQKKIELMKEYNTKQKDEYASFNSQILLGISKIEFNKFWAEDKNALVSSAGFTISNDDLEKKIIEGNRKTDSLNNVLKELKKK